MGKLFNQTNGNSINIEFADTFFKRFLGLMGRKSIEETDGLLFVLNKPSIMDAGIHMFFMRFDIAVIWLAEDLTVIDKILAKKWHPSYVPKKKAKYFLETHLSQLNKFSEGDQMEILP